MLRLQRAFAGLLAASLAACSASPEDQVARAAERITALNDPSIASARAEGNRLIVRYKQLDRDGLSDDEIARMVPAGLCSLPEFRAIVADGAAITLEIPRAFDFFSIDVDDCSDYD
jgi:hypothetical protein